MNERKQDTLFTPGITSRRWTYNTIYFRWILDFIGKGIGIISLSIAFADSSRKVWERNRVLYKLRQKLYKIPIRYRQAGSVIINLLTLLVTGSFLTLVIFSRNTAQQYWLQYTIIVFVLSFIGFLFPLRKWNNGRL